MLCRTPERSFFKNWMLSTGLIALGVIVGVVVGTVSNAWGQEMSYRLRVPSSLPGRDALSNQLHSKIRVVLMHKGFVVKSASAMREGYHLDISVAMEESFRADEPPTCVLQLIFQIVIMPQKRLVMNASSSGKSHFNQATQYTIKKRDHLRRMAIEKAMQYFESNVRRAIDKIEKRKQNLPQNVILGRKWHRSSNARWRGTVPASSSGKGGTVRWKWLPTSIDALRHRPPFPARPTHP